MGSKNFDAEKQNRLWANYAATRSTADRNALAEAYIPLAKAMAKRIKGRGKLEWCDLLSEVYYRLLQAIESFKTDGGASFPTYLWDRVKFSASECHRRNSMMKRSSKGVYIGSLDNITRKFKEKCSFDGYYGGAECIDDIADESETFQLPVDADMEADDECRRMFFVLGTRNAGIAASVFRDGLSQVEASRLHGVSEPTVSNIAKAARKAAAEYLNN